MATSYDVFAEIDAGGMSPAQLVSDFLLQYEALEGHEDLLTRIADMDGRTCMQCALPLLHFRREAGNGKAGRYLEALLELCLLYPKATFRVVQRKH